MFNLEIKCLILPFLVIFFAVLRYIKYLLFIVFTLIMGIVIQDNVQDYYAENLVIQGHKFVDDIHIVSFDKDINEIDIVDDAHIHRRNIGFDIKLNIGNNVQNYIDFLESIFSCVPNKGTPRSDHIPKQPLGYGLLYLQHLF